MQKKQKKKKKGYAFVKAKRKCCVATATARKGKGIILLNRRPVDTIESKYIRMIILEPTMVAPEYAKDIDFFIVTKGGGSMGHAIAARSAIAKAMVELSDDEKLRKTFLAYDRLMLVDDVRRVEPKKPLGPKARTKKQRSKR